LGLFNFGPLSAILLRAFIRIEWNFHWIGSLRSTASERKLPLVVAPVAVAVRHSGNVLGAALGAFAGKISEEEMRRMNYAMDGEHRDPAKVVRAFRNAKGL
jgi:hypothetical protein